MNWRDFFYFSKGERRAFTLLLCLITLSWILLLVTDEKTGPVTLETVASPFARQPEPDEQSLGTNSFSARRKNNQIQAKKKNPANENFKSIKTIPRFSYGKKTSASYPHIEKYPEGTLVELNTADTIILKKIPGIGSTFARRIIKYRELLGGYYSVSQLREVYGIDEERFRTLEHWFSADDKFIDKLFLNYLPADSLRKHPYLNYRQAHVIERLRKQKTKLSGWENLSLLDEFTDTDRIRLTPYLSFE